MMRSENIVFTQDIKLAACLGVLGFRLRNPDPMEMVSRDGGRPDAFFYFINENDIASFITAWDSPHDSYSGSDPNHTLKNAEHPFWWIRAALRARERFLDAIKKEAPITQILNRGGKSYFKTQWK